MDHTPEEAREQVLALNLEYSKSNADPGKIKMLVHSTFKARTDFIRAMPIFKFAAFLAHFTYFKDPLNVR